MGRFCPDGGCKAEDCRSRAIFSGNGASDEFKGDHPEQAAAGAVWDAATGVFAGLGRGHIDCREGGLSQCGAADTGAECLDSSGAFEELLVPGKEP